MPSGRKKAPIDWKKVDEMFIAGCHGTDIAAYFGIDRSTLYRRVEQEKKMEYTTYYHQKRAIGDNLLRSKQFSKAMNGDTTLLIWLGKVRLEQREAEVTPQQTADEKTLEMLSDVIAKNKLLQEELDALKSKTTTEHPAVDESL